MDENTISRFESKVDRSGGEDACHWWRAGRRGRPPTLYGQFWLDGVPMYAHRVAWIIAVGPVPDDVLIRHSCDQPLCVNPRHLAAGTPLDNMHDRIEHGAGYAHGEQHHNARLTQDLITEAIKLRGEGWIWKDVAAAVGTSQSAIERAVRKVTWRHL